MTTIIPGPSGLYTLLARTVLWPLRVAEHRRVLKALAGLNDHELADIGLSRQDLRDVTALPLAVDPTDLLQQRARSRAEAALSPAPPPTPDPGAAVSPAPFRIAAE